jgi:hypothetical protein
MATFTIEVSGTEPVSIQWEEDTAGDGNFSAMSGETSNTLTVDDGSVNHYRAQVSNACGAETSNVVRVLQAYVCDVLESTIASIEPTVYIPNDTLQDQTPVSASTAVSLSYYSLPDSRSQYVMGQQKPGNNGANVLSSPVISPGACAGKQNIFIYFPTSGAEQGSYTQLYDPATNDVTDSFWGNILGWDFWGGMIVRSDWVVGVAPRFGDAGASVRPIWFDYDPSGTLYLYDTSDGTTPDQESSFVVAPNLLDSPCMFEWEFISASKTFTYYINSVQSGQIIFANSDTMTDHCIDIRLWQSRRGENNSTPYARLGDFWCKAGPRNAADAQAVYDAFVLNQNPV